jgi:hypothetical protein
MYAEHKGVRPDDSELATLTLVWRASSRSCKAKAWVMRLSGIALTAPANLAMAL